MMLYDLMDPFGFTCLQKTRVDLVWRVCDFL